MDHTTAHFVDSPYVRRTCCAQPASAAAVASLLDIPHAPHETPKPEALATAQFPPRALEAVSTQAFEELRVLSQLVRAQVRAAAGSTRQQAPHAPPPRCPSVGSVNT